MRSSKRLQEKKTAISSETEGSSQEETAPIETIESTSKEDEYIALKISTSEDEETDEQGFCVDRIGSSQDELQANAENFSSLSETDEFLSIPEEFKRKLKGPSELSSELQVDINTQDLYLKLDKERFKPVTTNESFDDVCNYRELLKRSVITSDFEKRQSIPPMHVSQYAQKKQRKKAREETAGPKWFNLPATQITPEIERDMKLMKMRNVLDKKRHYKKNDSSALPKYFQIGTVVEGSADFYSSRIPKRQRKTNMIDELLADAEFRRYNKKKYLEIQAAKQSGKKGFYKKKKNKRKPTSLRS
ncbi:deoxynucleotidyltransferase terminal-interacting protein 2-like [Stylophora pistillata]|uniref:Deoxynucleotidyltransferase terminal-interacting protein 2 n=1 Tax=Stylophora pistillata TaxID=50429 RepID=A0A2B4SGC1_STYPI|nr:deoxynucleotidyltransferase terminal-interacting protein 2-like [Stylophora pistillata]PFX28149.1 Deoxynucleotidyltransferase terminal-interacting protein 2 [Stylophora pistillata]